MFVQHGSSTYWMTGRLMPGERQNFLAAGWALLAVLASHRPHDWEPALYRSKPPSNNDNPNNGIIFADSGSYSAWIKVDPGTEALKWKKPSQITFDSSFKDACAVEVFRDKWITAKTWAQIIFKHFKLNETLRFNDTDLVKALGLKQSKEKFKKTT
jgi:hypothetical protein